MKKFISLICCVLLALTPVFVTGCGDGTGDGGESNEISLPQAEEGKTNLVVEVVFPICVPIANTNTPEIIEPKNAPPLIVVIPIDETPPKTITDTAPADAPDDIPNT